MNDKIKKKNLNIELISNLAKQNDYKKIVEIWEESSQYKIDFNNEIECQCYSYIIDSYFNSQKEAEGIRLIKIELNECTNFINKPINYEYILLKYLQYYLELKKNLRAYKILLLLEEHYKSKNTVVPNETKSILEQTEYIHLFKPIRFFFNWIYPISVGIPIVIDSFIFSIFPNKLFFTIFAIANLVIIFLITYTKFDIASYSVKQIRKLLLWNIKT